MRIPSGVTDQYLYFVAVDATDLKTRETGLSSFTVYRSRNGGAATAFTTPTVAEVSAANMPGLFTLLLDEDMTIDAGDDEQEMVFHITHTGMAPVTRSITIYRRTVTTGNTLGVASDGDISGNVDGNVVGSVASVTGAVGSVTGNVGGNVVGSVASVTGAVGSVTGNVGGNVTGSVGSVAAGGITAASIATDAIDADALAADAVNEIADQVWDEVLTGATHNVATSAGRRLRQFQDGNAYEGGAVWIDTINGTAGTTLYENGTPGLPVDTISDALTLAAAAGLKHLHIVNGSTITLASGVDNYEFTGDEWGLALGGQSVNSASINSAHLAGVGVSGTFTGNPHLLHSTIGAITGPNARIGWCALTAAITSNGTGTWVIHSCWGLAGASFDFGAGGAQTVYITDWLGGPISIANMAAGDVLYFEGVSASLTLAASCTGGTVYVAGDVALTNSGSGLTINDAARFAEDQSIAAVTGAVASVTGTVGGIAGTITTLDALDTAQDSQHSTTQSAISALNDPTAAAIADAVWTEAIADHSGTAGSTAEALNAAGSAGDPWTTTLPGSYTGSQAGKILSDILTDTAEIGTAGAGLTALPWNAAWDAEVESEVNDGLVALGLDHLVFASVTGTDVTDNSIIARMVSSSATADWDTFVQTTDSLQAIRDYTADASTLSTIDGKIGSPSVSLDSSITDIISTLGTSGDGLTALPWNAAWDAEVESEANDALVALHLDHLLAVDYDPASKPGTATALLNELVEDDLGVSRFTTNALEQAPSGGGGGDATEAKQDTIIALAKRAAYVDGAVWVNVGAANTNTTSYEDGTPNQPVSTFAAAKTIMTAVGLNRIVVTGGPITLSSALTYTTIVARGADITFGGGGAILQQCQIIGANIEGDLANGSDGVDFIDCHFHNNFNFCTGVYLRCGFGSGTLNVAGNVTLTQCFSIIPGATAPTFTRTSVINLNVRHWSGGLTLSSLATGDTASLEGIFGTVTLNGADAAVELRGIYKALTNNLTGSPTVNAIGVKGTDVADILVDTGEIGTAGAGLTGVPWNAAWDAEVESEVTDALNAYDPPTNAAMEARTLVAADYATSANQTTILARLGAWTGSGVNTILGAFKALLSKTASAPSDIGGTFDPAADSTEAISESIDSVSTAVDGLGTGTGANVVTLTFTDGSNPLEGVLVRAEKTTGGIAHVWLTDSNGEVVFNLDSASYNIAATEAAHSFGGAVLVVSGSPTTQTYAMTAKTVPSAPSDPSLCRVYGYLRELDSNPKSTSPSFTLSIISPKNGPVKVDGKVISTKSITLATDVNGDLTDGTNAYRDLYRTDQMTPSGCVYQLSAEGTGFKQFTFTLEGATQDVADLITA